MFTANKQPSEIIQALYLRALTRNPTAKENEHLLAAVQQGKDPNEQKQILEDIFWALLNSKEFIFNH